MKNYDEKTTNIDTNKGLTFLVLLFSYDLFSVMPIIICLAFLMGGVVVTCTQIACKIDLPDGISK